EEEERVVMLPILKQDQAQKFAKLAHPTKFILKVAMPDKWSLQKNPALKQSTKTAADVSADYMKLELSTRPGVTHRLKASAKDLASAFFKAAGEDESLADAAHTIFLEGYTNKETGHEKVSL